MSSEIRLGFGLVGCHTIVLTGGGVLSISIFDNDDSTNPEELEYPEELLVGRHNLVLMGGGKFSISIFDDSGIKP